MRNKIMTRLLLIVLAIIPVLGAGYSAVTSGADESPFSSPVREIYADVSNGSDLNSGSSLAPVKTFRKALSNAIRSNLAGYSTRLWLRPGEYAEQVWYNRTTHFAGASMPADKGIVIQAETAGTVYITGASNFPYAGWTADSGAYYHTWNYDWHHPGTVASNDTHNGVYPYTLSGLALNREKVIINDRVMTHVSNAAAAVSLNNVFWVDTNANRIWVKPASALSAASKIRVSVFPVQWSTTKKSTDYPDGWKARLLYLTGLQNIKFTGINFCYSAHSVFGYRETTLIDRCTNVIFDDCRFYQNGGTPLYLIKSKYVTIRNSEFSSNGVAGLESTMISDYVISNCNFIGNNVKGVITGMTGNIVAGFKTLHTHRAIFQNCSLSENAAAGLWLDTDIENVEILNCSMNNNRVHGTMLEKFQGPVLLSNCVVSGNRYGIYLASSSNVTIKNSYIISNTETAIRSDQYDHELGDIINFETSQNYGLRILPAPVLITNSIIEQQWNSNFFQNGFNWNDWGFFVSNLQCSHVSYWCPGLPASSSTGFLFNNGGATLKTNYAGWETRRGTKEYLSHWSNRPGIPASPGIVLANGREVTLSWIAGRGQVISSKVYGSTNAAFIPAPANLIQSQIGGNFLSVTVTNYGFRYYRISHTDGLGRESGASEILPLIILPPPYNVEAESENATSVTLKWVTTEKYPYTGFRIYEKTGSVRTLRKETTNYSAIVSFSASSGSSKLFEITGYFETNGFNFESAFSAASEATVASDYRDVLGLPASELLITPNMSEITFGTDFGDIEENAYKDVIVKIFTIDGALYYNFFASMPTENLSISWNLRNKEGRMSGTGIYLYEISVSQSGKTTRKTGHFCIIR